MGMRLFRIKGGNHRDPRHALEKLYLDGRPRSEELIRGAKKCGQMLPYMDGTCIT